MLCRFLHKVQTYSDYNRMDLNNLAIVFAPTILKNNSGDISLEMSDMTKLKKVVEVTLPLLLKTVAVVKIAVN